MSAANQWINTIKLSNLVRIFLFLSTFYPSTACPSATLLNEPGLLHNRIPRGQRAASPRTQTGLMASAFGFPRLTRQQTIWWTVPMELQKNWLQSG